MKSFLCGILLLLLVLLAASSCLAHEALSPASTDASIPTFRRRVGETTDEQDEEHDEKTPPLTRECDWSADSFEVQFGCKATTPNDASTTEIQDEIDFTVKTSYKGVGVFVEYKQEVESLNMESETETSFEIWFDRIVEYAKSDGSDTGIDSSSSQAYDWQRDTVVKTLYLLEWNDFTEISSDGKISHFSVTTPQQVATFNFTIRQGHDVSQELVSTANKMKIDFLLNDLTWKEREDTYVALMSHLESERNVELDHDGDHAVESVMPRNAIISFQQQQAATMNKDLVPFGEFTWQDTAQAIDNTTETTSNGNVSVQVERAAELGTTIQVVATSPPIVSERQPGDKSSEFIAFSFVGEGARSASEIYWDPEAGVGYGTSTSTSGAERVLSGSILNVIGIIIGAGVFALPFI